MEPTFHFFRNQESLAQVKRALLPLMPFMPTWAREMGVFYQGPSNETIMHVVPDVKYRRIALNICDGFWTFEAPKQRRMLIHEFIHMLHGDVMHFVKMRLINPMESEKPEVFAILDEEFDERLERFTQELTFLLEDLLPS